MHIRLKGGAVAGKGCGVLFFSIFAVAGLIFTALAGMIFYDTARTYTWRETPCEILASSVQEKERDYIVSVTYRYQFDGREYTGTRLRKDDQTFDKSRDAQQAARRHPAETRGICYVNPANPADAILERDSLWMGLIVLFPLLFVAVGVGGIIFTLRSKPAESTAASERHGAAKKGCGVAGLRLFGLVFFAVGAGVMYAMLIGPWLSVRAAAHWREVPCTITSSRLKSHSDSDGTTYSLDIRYTFEWDGRTLTGDQYDFSTGSSSSRGWRQEILDRHPEGTRTVCYVNPDDPSESVLSRSIGGDWWFGFIPGISLLVGLGIMLGAGKMAATGARPAHTRPAPVRATIAGSGAVELKPASSPFAGFLVFTFFALFWNGITWGIILGAKPAGFVLLFLSLFILIGLLLIAGVIYTFLAMLNPRPILTASTASITPGDTLRVDWRFTGNPRRISKLTLVLEGHETATYRRGTTTSTDRSLFARHTIHETTDRAQIAAGHAAITLPGDTLHSFKSPNNSIEWTLSLHGDIARWPDVDLTYPLEVLPAPPAAAPAAPTAPAGPPALSGDGPLRLGLRGGRTAFQPGEPIHGAALWELDTTPELAEVRLLWHTRGKGTEDGEVIATHTFDHPRPGDTRTFTFTAPPAPHSFSGKLVALIWAIELVLKPGGKFVRTEITITPGGREILLPEIEQPKKTGLSLRSR